jgi:hypothetical protein
MYRSGTTVDIGGGASFSSSLLQTERARTGLGSGRRKYLYGGHCHFRKQVKLNNIENELPLYDFRDN